MILQTEFSQNYEYLWINKHLKCKKKYRFKDNLSNNNINNIGINNFKFKYDLISAKMYFK